MLFDEITWKQECIPVGCVPPASVAATRCQYQEGVKYSVPYPRPLGSYPLPDHIPLGLSSPFWDHTPSKTIPQPPTPVTIPLPPTPGTISPLLEGTWDQIGIDIISTRTNMGLDRKWHHTSRKNMGPDRKWHHTPLPQYRMTDTCRNITFPQLRLRAVKFAKHFTLTIMSMYRRDFLSEFFSFWKESTLDANTFQCNYFAKQINQNYANISSITSTMLSTATVATTLFVTKWFLRKKPNVVALMHCVFYSNLPLFSCDQGTDSNLCTGIAKEHY